MLIETAPTGPGEKGWCGSISKKLTKYRTEGRCKFRSKIKDKISKFTAYDAVGWLRQGALRHINEISKSAALLEIWFLGDLI